jgi:hypothetical protein
MRHLIVAVLAAAVLYAAVVPVEATPIRQEWAGPAGHEDIGAGGDDDIPTKALRSVSSRHVSRECDSVKLRHLGFWSITRRAVSDVYTHFKSVRWFAHIGRAAPRGNGETR